LAPDKDPGGKKSAKTEREKMELKDIKIHQEKLTYCTKAYI
jgi:hypothetical protein